MFRASPRPSSGAYNCTRSLWFYRWSEAAGALLVVVWQVTHKRQSNKLVKLLHLVVDLFESYDDARTCKRQISKF
jgi:hypothetical protein